LVVGNSATLRWTITNGSCSSTDDVIITANAGPGCEAYCASTATNSLDEHITDVVMTGGLSNTGTGSDLYTDYTATKVASVIKGQNMELTVTTNTTYMGDFVYVFIDYNDDGDFTDAGETVYGAQAAEPSVITFTIPSTASAATTRMRIKFGYAYDANFMDSDPCQATFADGEVEDYGLVIAAITDYPYTADFEGEVDYADGASLLDIEFVTPGWRNTQTGDGADWRADAGGTVSSLTGPGTGAPTGQPDQTPGTAAGMYLYYETSAPNYTANPPYVSAYLLTPTFDLTSNSFPIMEFWYNMYGATMGDLELQASTDGGDSWSSNLKLISGDQGIGWKQAIVDLIDYRGETNLMFRFTGTSTTSWTSDFALDNFRVLDMATSPIDVYEDLTLYSDAFESSGTTVNMVGSSAQSIQSGVFNFTTISINNSNGVTLSDNLTTSNIILLSGIVSGAMVTITNTYWAAIVGGSGTSYISGTLTRYIAANKNTYAFPIGQGSGPTNYFKANFTNNLLNLPGSTDWIQMSVAAEAETGDNIDGNLIATQDLTPIINIHENAIWTITPSMGGAFLSGDYSIDLYTANISGIEDNKFTILKRPTASTSYVDWDTNDETTTIAATGGAGRMVADGYARKKGFEAFSKFAVGSGSNTLPIELIDFNAFEKDGIIYIDWATVSEINNDYFTIERSKDGSDFEFIDEVLGAGTSNHLITYGTIDEDPYYGTSYYRLKQTDFDGKFEYSDLEIVNILTELKFSVKPNPAHDRLEMTFGSLADGVIIMTTAYNAKIEIHDIQGKLVYQKNFDGAIYKFNIDISKFDKGMYFVSFESNSKVRQTKFVKE